ncbi:hypothetical protein AVEN_214834-1 [Araneus ventricosus]|uniref:Uncharacterized protein n=1 Tax=Araneus ventricosus TaxID=182803 RepID=A0A4Y2QKX6_ARAVE|nr:hypothetical protein AVEN_214834-1 [Araneus ventricosus]
MRRARALACLKATRFSVVGHLRNLFHIIFSLLRLSRQVAFHHGLRNFLRRGKVFGMLLLAAFVMALTILCTASEMSAVLTIFSVISASCENTVQSARWKRKRVGQRVAPPLSAWETRKSDRYCRDHFQLKNSATAIVQENKWPDQDYGRYVWVHGCKLSRHC